MSEKDRAFEITGVTSDVELIQYLEGHKAKLENLETELENKNTELEATKRERTTARTQATKADSKLAELKENYSALMETSKKQDHSNSDLKAEIDNLSREIVELKEKVNQSKKGLPSLNELKAKAKIILLQEKVDKVFISLNAQVFLRENQCKNASGTKYKVAVLVDDDKVQLSNP
jgi:chromosome segregation ATPase